MGSGKKTSAELEREVAEIEREALGEELKQIIDNDRKFFGGFRIPMTIHRGARDPDAIDVEFKVINEPKQLEDGIE